MTPQWIGIAISVVVMLGGTAVNLFIIGRFVGQMSEALKNSNEGYARHDSRLDEVEARGAAHNERMALYEGRLGQAESAASKFWEYRDAFTAMKVTVELEARASRERQDSMARSIGVIERQLGNLVGTKAGFTTLSSEG